LSTPLDPERWQAVEPFLDRALAFPTDEARSEWLAQLQAEQPDVADELRSLLSIHRAAAEDRFLEHAIELPGGQAVPGQLVGAYKLVSPIGQGGMGSVWLAERSDGRFDRPAALKFLHVALAGRGEARFKREGRILGRLTHPHIANLLDAGVSPDGRAYLVLEYVEGLHIDQYCDRHNLDVKARVRLFLDVLDAVAHAHANLIVHRDIKPSNVLISTTGQVKLLDFGIAKLLEDEGDTGEQTQLTREAGVALTPRFAAPEQVAGGTITTATDVYALGNLLYVLLTGTHPAAGSLGSPAELYRAVVDREPRRPSDVVPGSRRAALRGDLDTIVLKSLKKDPRERYSSVAALGSDLRRHLAHEPIAARPDSVAYRAAKFVRRNRTAVALSALAAIAIIAGMVGTLLQMRAARRQRDFAYRQLARAERINHLDEFLLTDAAPGGNPLTINELLDRAVRIVDREDYSRDAGSHVEQLISIGIQYSSRGDVKKSLSELEKAYTLSRALQEPSVRARAACALSIPLNSQFELARAESLVHEGLREVPNDTQFALDRTFCLLRDASVAMTTGATQHGIDSVESADRALKDSAFQSDYLKLSVLKMLGAAYLMGARHRESIAAYEQAAAQVTRLGYDDTRVAAWLFHDWGLAVAVAGRPAEAERIFRRALEIFQGKEDTVPTALLVEYAGALGDLGREEEAAVYAERAYVRAKQTNDRQYLSSSLMARAGIYRDQRDFPRAAAMLDELEALIRRGLPAGHYGFGSLASARALLAQAEGDAPRALALANQAVALVEATIKAGGQGAHLLPVLLIRRSAIALDNDQPEAAASDARRALALLEVPATSGEFSVNTGRAYVLLGRALEAQGQIEKARAAARSAAAHLDRALAADHPEAREARRLADASR
jgi:serine/threonine-protein kinase